MTIHDVHLTKEKIPQGGKIEFWTVTYQNSVLGKYRDPEHDVARYFLRSKLGDKSDYIQYYVNGQKSLCGRIDNFAPLKVNENSRFSPHFVKWIPFPTTT